MLYGGAGDLLRLDSVNALNIVYMVLCLSDVAIVPYRLHWRRFCLSQGNNTYSVRNCSQQSHVNR